MHAICIAIATVAWLSGALGNSKAAGGGALGDRGEGRRTRNDEVSDSNRRIPRPTDGNPAGNSPWHFIDGHYYIRWRRVSPHDKESKQEF